MRSLQRAFANGQATSIRLTPSQPSTPVNESFSDFVIAEEQEEINSRRGSDATSSTASSGAASLLRGTSAEPVVVAVHLTPLKNEQGKAEVFVFVLARRYGDV